MINVKTLGILILAAFFPMNALGQSGTGHDTDRSVSASQELFEIFQQDQGDRSGGGEIDWTVVSSRDRNRRARVLELLDSNTVVTSDDYYHAAMVFQHGSDTAAARLAHTLAQTAVELDSTNSPAKWLMAAAWDRYQMRLGKPQWYGTQYVKDSRGIWQLYEIDTTAVTDAMRTELGVPSLKESRARVSKFNQK